LLLANHAMFELPLYYGYFLWPLGVLLGAFVQRTSGSGAITANRVSMLCLWCACALFLVLTARDYFGVEDEYQASRLNTERVDSKRTVDARMYPFLTQWDDYFKYSKLMAIGNMQAPDIAGLENVLVMWPSPALFNKLAMALAMQHRPEEASLWLYRMCAMTPEGSCIQVVTYWKDVLQGKPEYSAVQLPVLPNRTP
jgi:hypothetical protein